MDSQLHDLGFSTAMEFGFACFYEAIRRAGGHVRRNPQWNLMASMVIIDEADNGISVSALQQFSSLDVRTGYGYFYLKSQVAAIDTMTLKF
jgi:hypothetical protein